MDILTELTTSALKSVEDVDRLRIDNIIVGKSFYTMKHSATVFSDMRICLVLLEHGYGFSYFQSDSEWQPDAFVNQRITDVLSQEIPLFFRTALIDAIYSTIRVDDPSNVRLLSGTLREKARKRAQIVLSSVEPGSKVLLLGAVTELVEEALALSCEVSVLDLEEQKIGLSFWGETVRCASSSSFVEKVSASDYVVATGMIFPCGWAEEVFDTVEATGKKLVLYMETGANFGAELLRYGAHAVFAEFFPFYDFFGETRCALYEQNRQPKLNRQHKLRSIHENSLR